MTPEAQALYLDDCANPAEHPFYRRTIRSELEDMCESGAKAVAAGRYDALDFSLFNEAEATFVKAYMDEHHPTVPYRRRWTAFKA